MTSPPPGRVEPLFATLRKVGYGQCAHPRLDRSGACADCGATQAPGSTELTGGSLDFARKDLA